MLLGAVGGGYENVKDPILVNKKLMRCNISKYRQLSHSGAIIVVCTKSYSNKKERGEKREK